MIINFFGIQLQIIDNGDGTFSVKPLDAEADRASIRDEIQRLKDERTVAQQERDAAISERDYHIERRAYFVDLRQQKVDEVTALSTRITELRDFLVAAGDPDPGT